MIRLHNLWNGAKVCKGKFIALNYFICEQGEKKKLRLLTLKKEQIKLRKTGEIISETEQIII